AGAFTPYTVPITAANLPEIGTLTLRISYNPQVLRAQAAVQGTFMAQGSVSPTFVPRIDANAGTVDLVLSRPNTARGASGSDLIGSVQFLAMAPGSARIRLSGSANERAGQPMTGKIRTLTVGVKRGDM